MDDHTQEGMSDSVKLGILIHRMGTLETDIGGLGKKIDNMGTAYPTMIHVDLLLQPLREKIADLEEDKKEKEKEESSKQGQFRLALIMAVLSPIFSIIITILLDRP